MRDSLHELVLMDGMIEGDDYNVLQDFKKSQQADNSEKQLVSRCGWLHWITKNLPHLEELKVFFSNAMVLTERRGNLLTVSEQDNTIICSKIKKISLEEDYKHVVMQILDY